uniref:Putative transketolase domain containing protein n=1 Tax=viral metagenome TaxID=1070528 RepID=A0A6M3JBA8_9ZZZZ
MRKTCFNLIYELAKKDERIVYIGSDVGAGTLESMKQELPKQFFMEGIQEQNIIGMATGLALSGRIVYVNTLATFITRRCYEQVCLDVGLHNANVRLLGNGGGLVYAPLGPTHEATDDIALMRSIPNMTIICPADHEEMIRLMPQTVDYPHPMYIRFGKDKVPIVSINRFEIGKANFMKQGSRALVITTGHTTALAMQVPNVTVLHCHTIKPLDEKTIKYYAREIPVITVEEHNLVGGLGSAVLEMGIPCKRIGIPDEFVEIYGTRDSQMEYYGITVEGIENAINNQ